MAGDKVWVGIDVAFAKGKRLPVCICKRIGQGLQPLTLRAASCFAPPPAGRGNRLALDESERAAFARQTLAWLEGLTVTHRLDIERIAIDAPRHYAEGRRRSAERAMDERGISCFATPTKDEFARKIEEARKHLDAGGEEARMPNANQFWMLVGFALFDALAKFDCIEVFPQAIIRELGCGRGHKSTAIGFDEQVEQFAAALGKAKADVVADLNVLGYGGRHDRLDAYLSAWIASLPEASRIACGTAPLDVIWVPRLQPKALPALP